MIRTKTGFPIASFRLAKRSPGSRGLACDEEGVSLGPVPLVLAERDGAGRRVYRAVSAPRLGKVLAAAYGPEFEAQPEAWAAKFDAIARALTEGRTAEAAIRAVHLRLPELSAEAAGRLALLAKYSEDQPRIPAGEHGGGRWVRDGEADGGDEGQQVAAAEPDPKQRALTPGEIELARSIFGDRIRYGDVTVYHAKAYSWQRDDVTMAPDGNIYFPPGNPDYCDDFSTASVEAQAHFLHEMTHVLQHQEDIPVAVEWFFHSRYQYDLLDQNGNALPFDTFGVEQQAEIVQDYFLSKNGRGPALRGQKGFPLSVYETSWKSATMESCARGLSLPWYRATLSIVDAHVSPRSRSFSRSSWSTPVTTSASCLDIRGRVDLSCGALLLGASLGINGDGRGGRRPFRIRCRNVSVQRPRSLCATRF